MRYLILFFLLVSFGAAAQKIKGKVLDTDKSPVEFASVRVLSKDSSTVVTGVYTDVNGVFETEPLSPGSYVVKITFSGLEDFIEAVQLEKGAEKDFAAIVLPIDKSINLDEVEAVGSLDVLKAGIDKKVYSVEDDISVRGGSVNDVLNNIPSIDIDQDGNITLRGDGNVTILIDGRPSTLAVGDGQNMLDALPANSIERIEVVTNPSAKYDPDGTSGIINIVMKKNKLKGFNGMASVTAGTGNQYEANLGLSYRNKNFNLYFNYSFNYYEGYRNYKSDLEQDITADSTTRLLQERDGTDQRMTNTLVLGSDFYFNDRNVFAFSATGSLGDRERTGALENRSYNGLDELVRRWDRDSRDPRSSENFDVNLNYTNTFKDDKGSISFNGNQSFGNEAVEGFYEQSYYDENEVLTDQAFLNQRLKNNSNRQMSTAQIDYAYIFKKIRARTEFGSKMIIQNDDLDTYSETMDTLTSLYYEDTVANFTYRYEEEIYSLYGIFGQELGKFKYQIGVRGEYAKQVPFLVSTGEKIDNTYLNLFPSAHIKYNMSKTSELSVSYSRRINRAESRQLNPFTSYADPMNLRSGNPQLQPEYIDSYDLGYSLSTKKLILSVSTFHKRTTDVINRVKLYYPNNIAVLTYGNIDNSVSTGLETVIIYKPFKWMKNTLSFNGSYMDYSDTGTGTDWNNDGYRWGVKYMLGVDFWKRTASVQLNANYSAPQPTPQGIIQRGTKIDISVEKSLLQKRMTIGARVTDIFNTMGFTGQLDQPGVRQSIQYKWLTRRFLVSLSYRIGKYESKTPRSDDGGGDAF